MRNLILTSLLFLTSTSASAQKAGAPVKFDDLNQGVRESYGKPAISSARPAGPVIKDAGTVEFDFDAKDFPLDLIGKEYGSWFFLELGFDANDNLSHCNPMPFAYSINARELSPDSEHFCKIARSKLRFLYNPKYMLDAPSGYLAVNVLWNKKLFPAKPYRLSRNASGIEIKGIITTTRSGKASNCEIWTRGLSDGEKTEICGSLGKSPLFTSRLAACAKRGGGARKSFTAWLDAAKPAPSPESYVEVSEMRYDSTPDPYTYPGSIPTGVAMMPTGIGQFFLTLDHVDRPDKNLAAWEQAKGYASLALEIAPDGSILSCKPHIGSDNAGLDLKACEIAKARGRFVFTSGIRIDKPHYYSAKVEWPAPKY